MIILNELKMAKEIYESGDICSQTSEKLTMISKYLYQQGIRNKKLFEALDKYMEKNYVDYNPVEWRERLEGRVKRAGDHLLLEVDSIPITEAEILAIQEIKTIRLQRLAFTLLCLAKYTRLKNPDSNGWVWTSINDIFNMAVIVAGEKVKCEMLHELFVEGYIGLSKKITNNSIKVNYLNDDSPVVLEVSDFRRLGYEYMIHTKQGKFVRCAKCGLLVKRKTNNQKYCKSCAHIVQAEQMSEWEKTYR